VCYRQPRQERAGVSPQESQLSSQGNPARPFGNSQVTACPPRGFAPRLRVCLALPGPAEPRGACSGHGAERRGADHPSRSTAAERSCGSAAPRRMGSLPRASPGTPGSRRQQRPARQSRAGCSRVAGHEEGACRCPAGPSVPPGPCSALRGAGKGPAMRRARPARETQQRGGPFLGDRASSAEAALASRARARRQQLNLKHPCTPGSARGQSRRLCFGKDGTKGHAALTAAAPNGQLPAAAMLRAAGARGRESQHLRHPPRTPGPVTSAGARRDERPLTNSATSTLANQQRRGSCGDCETDGLASPSRDRNGEPSPCRPPLLRSLQLAKHRRAASDKVVAASKPSLCASYRSHSSRRQQVNRTKSAQRCGNLPKSAPLAV